MRKFIKKLGVLSILIITPLTLASFNKPTFAMESNSNTSIQSKLDSLNEKAEDLDRQLNNLKIFVKNNSKLKSFTNNIELYNKYNVIQQEILKKIRDITILPMENKLFISDRVYKEKLQKILQTFLDLNKEYYEITDPLLKY